MRAFIIGLVVFLAACNQGNNNVPYSDPALVAQVDSLTKALADVTREQAEQAVSIKKLSLIGKVHGVASAERIMAIGQAAVIAPDFGPCPDMGVLIGRGISTLTSDPLASPTESFQQCTGYEYSVNMSTHALATAPRIFFSNADCTGQRMIWSVFGTAYNDQTLQQGAVFIDPSDGVTQYVVEKNQTPRSLEYKSAWVVNSPGCQNDDETQLVYLARPVIPQDAFGIPVNFGNFQLGSP